jgi:hypothetical protein
METVFGESESTNLAEGVAAMPGNQRLVSFPTVACLFVLLPLTRAPADQEQAGDLAAWHQAGQTFLTFTEVDPRVTEDSLPVRELKQILRAQPDERTIRYRIYRSDRPITSLRDRQPVAEIPPLSCWNADFYGASPKPEAEAFRYVVREGEGPVPPGTGICACSPSAEGEAYYAVTVVINGQENVSLDASNSLQQPVPETVGPGVPVLQRVVTPDSFHYVRQPTLYYYTRWESPPNCAEAGKPYDYLVAVPEKLAQPAPVGIHLHCWGANLRGGYGWWYEAEDGHLLIASNQVPYDWWTGYHERYFDGQPDEQTWKQGVVRPYTQTRLLSFLDWVATEWDVDLSRTHVAGNSMGGSGAPMLAIRYPQRIAWATSWVGVHNPAETPGFKGSYERVYGKRAWNVRFENGDSVWDYFNDVWYLERHPKKEIGLICFSNGKNDSGIGWQQAAAFYRALQATRRPHVFVWGQRGHGQRARLPISLSDRAMPMDLRTDQSQPAFTACSLNDDPGDGDPDDGDPEGQVNLYLYWETDSIIDQPERWCMTVGLVQQAPLDTCTVNMTPRRLQRFQPQPGEQLQWTNESVADGGEIQAGTAVVDQHGLVTLENVCVSTGGNRICIAR